MTAPAKADGAAKDATRGVHTLNFQVSSTIKASATIEVAGAPASITTNAPAEVDPASVTEITVSVWDDEGVLVGITEVRVRKVGGDGLIEDAGDNGAEKTVNGQSKFTYISPSSGSAEILITAGKVNFRLPLTVREEVEPSDTAPTLPDAPEFVSISRNPDGTLRVVTTPRTPPEGLVIESQVARNDGDWVAVPEGAPEAGDYNGRARFVDGDLASRWRFSFNSVTVDPEPEVTEPPAVTEPPEEPTDPEPPVEPTLTGSGALRIFSGGSVEDLHSAAEAACPGGADIWLQDSEGTWQRYSTTRPAFTNAPFNAAFAGGLGQTAVFLSICEADAMEDEG